jgi:hypothetical protein
MTGVAARAVFRKGAASAAFASVNAFLFVLLFLLSTDAIVRGAP